MRASRWASSGALAAAAVGGASAINGIRPFERRGRAAAAPVWLAGLAASEAPIACVAAQAGVVASVLRRGAIRSPAGLATVAVAGASSIGFAGLYGRALASEPVLTRSLEECFGPAYRTRQVQAAEPSRSSRSGLLLRLRQRYTTAESTAIAYGDAGPGNTLDVWRRADMPLTGRSPVLMQVHGGAWTMGDNRTQALPLVARMVESGWVCVLPRYRLSPRASWPDHIVDIMRAIAWTKANIGSFGGDPGFVALTGGSAGAHLSSLAALAGDHADFKPGFADTDTRVQAVVPLYGAYDWLDRDGTANPYTQQFVCDKVVQQQLPDAHAALDGGSPRSWVRSDAPPFFVIHGRNDALLPVEQARSFVAALRDRSESPVAYAELPFAQHGFDFARTPRTRATVEAVRSFLEVVYGDRCTEPARRVPTPKHHDNGKGS